ncbi:MFS transporter [Microbacterium sp. ZW T5_45]|uniref:MFS transporter n=1 Tax=Microbacterium sp. ZW T5_45 TaxID=3378080 RepID=UPI00385251B2
MTIPPEAPGAGPAPTTPGIDAAAPVATAQDDAPESMSRWLWFVYPLALIGIGSVWGAVISVLLGRQVAEIVTDPREAAGALGLVLSIASLVPLVAQPVMGRLSDITRTRFLGRRNLWILCSGIASGLVLIGLGMSQNLFAAGLIWALAMIPLSALQASLTAVLPERVPLARRGTMSGIVGTINVVGAVFGVALGGLAPTPFVGYFMLAVLLVVTSTLFAVSTKDVPPPARRAELTREQQRALNRLPGLRSSRDFWLTFLQRFLMIFGYFIISGFNLYLLRDYIGVGDGSTDAAAQMVVAVSGVASVFTLIFAMVGGVLSDRFGRVRIFVALSSLTFVPACVVFIFAPTLTGYFIAQGILGAAFGMYTAVDQVLITRVLPNNQNSARDLGLMNVANSGPQVIAPAVAGGVIAATGDYAILFMITAVVVVLGAITIRFIRSVP